MKTYKRILILTVMQQYFNDREFPSESRGNNKLRAKQQQQQQQQLAHVLIYIVIRISCTITFIIKLSQFQ